MVKNSRLWIPCHPRHSPAHSRLSPAGKAVLIQLGCYFGADTLLNIDSSVTVMAMRETKLAEFWPDYAQPAKHDNADSKIHRSIVDNRSQKKSKSEEIWRLRDSEHRNCRARYSAHQQVVLQG